MGCASGKAEDIAQPKWQPSPSEGAEPSSASAPPQALKNHAAADHAPIILELDEDAGNNTQDPDAKLCKFSCGKPVQPGLTRRGNPFDTCCRSCALNQGLGVHDGTCGGKKSAAPTRQACMQGAKCRNRSPAHLAAEAHPLDEDYAVSCAATKGIDAQPLTLKVLFDWTDADGSGKLSRKELESSLRDIRKIAGFLPAITEESWHHLDEDGNGVVNFSEFASWAGPRLGLPLGVQKMLAKTQTMSSLASPCSVLGCPCEALEGSHTHCRGCKHKSSLHVNRSSSTAEVPSPEYWTYHEGKFNERIAMGETAVQEFQQLVDRTYRDKWTRDRKTHNPTCSQVPTSFSVVRVQRNENSHSWQEYACKRGNTLERVTSSPVQMFTDVKTVTAWEAIGGAKKDRLFMECNEWYLFHGTNPAAAESICKSDFKVSRSGSNTGTLYGKGLYFAESITKADEYAKPNADGNFAVLVCRILGGNVKYTDQEEPDPEDLVQSCIEGPYDSVCGDREKVRGTYREFVLFDSEDAYVEYIIEYKRNYS